MTSQTKQTVGILGGSFNPVHIGHIILASYMVQWGYVDKVWLTLSPQNPLKDQRGMIPDIKRLAMLTIATRSVKDIEICDIELAMPRPSYTINTLDALTRLHPSKKFKLIIGSDNWRIFNQWRDADRILDEYGVIVYPRPGYPIERMAVDGMEVAHAPMLDLSSTFIRSAIAQGKNCNVFLPHGVFKYIVDNKYYR